MTRKFALLLLVAATLPFAGCNKIREKIPFLKKKESAAAPVPRHPGSRTRRRRRACRRRAGRTGLCGTEKDGTRCACGQQERRGDLLCYHNIEDKGSRR